MLSILTIIFAALSPMAFVKEIPESVRAENIISIAEARSRLIENQGQRVFFRVQGTIIADRVDAYHHFILLDKTAATDVITSCDDEWNIGDEVVVICTAMQPAYENPTLLSEALEIKILKHQTPSAPRFVHPVDLSGHRNDYNRVNLQGVVTDAFRDDVNPQWSILVLARDDVQTLVWTRTGDMPCRQLEDLLDTELLVTGIVLPNLNNSYRSHGPWMLTSSSDSIKIIRPQPTDPYATRLNIPHRQVVSGHVIACWKGDSFFLRTPNDQRVLVQLVHGSDLPSPGMAVTAAGFVRHNEFGIRFSKAICTINKDASPHTEEAVKVDARTLFWNTAGERQIDTKFNGRTICLSGLVKDQRSAGSDLASLSISAGHATLDIWIGKETAIPEIGSVIEVTGACLVEDTTDIDTGIVRATSISLALRSPKDIRVLTAPPWWTPARLIRLIALLGILLAAILVWIVILRKMIVRRSRELARETIRSTSAALRLEERTRVAVELHDTIAQNLTGASFEIQAALRLAASAPDKMKDHLAIADRTLKSCRDDIRNCIWDLRTNSLDQEDLDHVIRVALSPHIGDAALNIRFNVPRAKLSEPTLHALLRIVRELAINAVRHGHATEIKIAGSIDGNALLFSVRDNGCGFDPEQAPGASKGHFGLQGVRERIRKLDGSLTIDSSAEYGTRVSVMLNVHATPTTRKP